MKKVKVPEGYPPEEGCYLRGSDNLPVAALAGTLQTGNIGLEKVSLTSLPTPISGI